jgi:hypothetical protein
VRPLLHTHTVKKNKWIFTALIPALRRLRKENNKFKTSLNYIVRPCLKKNKKK